MQHLRTAFGRDGAETTDGVLTLFLDGRDDAALAALIRRHASMVYGEGQATASRNSVNRTAPAASGK